jgi:hypothetical protein
MTDAGTRIAAGDTVLVVVAAANRDPAAFDQPEQFRLDRHGPAPLSFGYGAHYSLGAAVARNSNSLPRYPKSLTANLFWPGRCTGGTRQPSAAL